MNRTHAAPLFFVAALVVFALDAAPAAAAARGRAQLKPGDAKKADEHVRHAARRLSDADPAEALKLADKALRLAPAHGGAHYLRGRALLYLFGTARRTAQDRLPRVERELTADERRAREDEVEAEVESWKPRLGEAADRMEEFARLNPSAPYASAPLWREQLESLRFYSKPMPRGRTAADTPPQPLLQRDVTAKAIIREKPDPGFPQGVCRDGVVALRAVLAADGRVKHILPFKLLPDGLTERAMAAARNIKFRPATKNGAPVSQFVTLEYNFNC